MRGVTGQDLTYGGLRLRAGPLPLFRRIEGGELRQAVRVVIDAAEEGAPVTLTLREGRSVLDQMRTAIGSGRTRLLLFVPEARRDRALTLEVSDGRADPLHTALQIGPQRKWSVYLVHHSHLDIGYTDPQAAVLRHHLAYLDAVLDFLDQTDDGPEPARFRWNVEATWPLLHWLASRPHGAVERFLGRVREGRIEVTALPYTMHTEAYSIDELARQLRFADELRERYGLPIVTAMQTDVPGITLGLLQLLVDADIRYLSVAHNYAGRSVPYLVGGQALTRPFWWEAPAGGRLLVWHTDTPHGGAYMEGNILGFAAGYEPVLDALPEYLAALASRPYPFLGPLFGWPGLDGVGELTRQPYPYDLLHLRVQGEDADNAPPSLRPAEVVRQWNERWAYPELRLATNREFFTAAEERLGDRLEVHRGDWTDWWADGIGSAARPLGFNRRSQSAIRAAQTLHALADKLWSEPSGRPLMGPSVWEEVDQAYEHMALFDEHTWGAANPWLDSLDSTDAGALQWHRKSEFAYRARETTDRLLEAGLGRLASLFARPERALGRLIVFNPSTWPRTDPVRVFLPYSRIPLDTRLIVADAETGQPVPHLEERQQHARFRPRGRYLVFLAAGVPPFGYALYDLIEERHTATPSATSQEPAIANEHYEVGVDLREGAVVRLHDRAAGRELVNDAAAAGFNQYVYDRYGTAPHFNHLSSLVHAADLALLGSRSVAGQGSLVARESSPVRERLTVRLTGEGVEWLETTLTLWQGVKRLDITNRLAKVATPEKESVFFAFPFRMPSPVVRYEITGGIGSPDGPRVPGSANHMRAIRHWLSLESEGCAVAWATLEAPLVQLGNLYLPYAPFPATVPPGHADPATVYSWALNNLWDTNFPSQQQGEMEFHYAVASGQGASGTDLGRRTAASLTVPLLGTLVMATADRQLPPRGSFCQVGHPEVEVLYLGPSRRGRDLVVWLECHAVEPLQAALTFPLLEVRRAWLGDHLERAWQEVPVRDGQVQVQLRPASLATLGLELGGP